jgi:hypothetical protein
MKAYDLAVLLQGVVVVNPQRLNDLTSKLCAGRDTGWDF